MTLLYTHSTVAILAVVLGMFLLLTQKGTHEHKVLGRIWAGCIAFISCSAIFIQVINPGHYTVVHLLIPVTMGTLIYSIYSIRKFQETKLEKYKSAHKYSMMAIYIAALLVAGLFTLMPGRLFHDILFG